MSNEVVFAKSECNVLLCTETYWKDHRVKMSERRTFVEEKEQETKHSHKKEMKTAHRQTGNREKEV